MLLPPSLPHPVVIEETRAGTVEKDLSIKESISKDQTTPGINHREVTEREITRMVTTIRD